jgi:mono/diheme cytochrome c family protein
MSDSRSRRRRKALAAAATLALAGLFIVTTRAADGPATVAGAAREVTFSRDIAPVVFENCVYCHRPGEVAPFSFLSYKEARPWARSIRQKVLNRQMPPWKADPHYGEFLNARILSQRDIDTLVAWVDGGAKEGDPSEMPAAPQFAEGWQIGTPDLVLTMKAPFPVPAAGAIPWMIIPSNDYVFPRDTWIQAVEVRPGNRRVVHHAVAQANYPGDNPNLGGGGLHLYSPGLDAMVWREGYGKLMPKGTRISFQMHYNANGTATTDQTKVGFKFATAPVHTQVNTIIMSNTSIVIPPMVQNHETITAFQFPVDSRIHAFRPHMHLRGRLATASLIMPDGMRSVLLHLPHWDDAWQNYYVLSKPVRVPKGAMVEYIASYDNSPANPLNPDPKATVAWGQQVWEEMFETYMTWTAINDKNANDIEPIQVPVNKAFTTGINARK